MIAGCLLAVAADLVDQVLADLQLELRPHRRRRFGPGLAFVVGLDVHVDAVRLQPVERALRLGFRARAIGARDFDGGVLDDLAQVRARPFHHLAFTIHG